MVEAVPMSFDWAVKLNNNVRDAETSPPRIAVMVRSRPSKVIVRDGVPVAAIGALEYAPGKFNLWIFATDDVRSVRFTLVKTIRRMVNERDRDRANELRLKPIDFRPAAR